MKPSQSITISALGFGIIAFTVIILLLIIAVTIITILARKQRIKQEVEFARARLAYESELRTIEAEVREATLAHIAAELHDNIGQLLAVAHFQLEKEKLQHPSLAALLTPADNTIQQLMDQVRLLSHSLSGEFINEGGLQSSISNEVQRLRSIARLNIEYATDNIEPELPKDARTVAFRIFQEIVANALKHSRASNLHIQLLGKEFLLHIRDDGKGFDKDVVLKEARGFGLKNMLRRASLAALICEVESSPENGSTFNIKSNKQVEVASS